MKKCPACNRSFDDENDFCLNDGTALRMMGANAPSFEKHPRTAKATAQPAQRTAVAAPAHADKLSKWLFLIIGILSATIVVGGFFIFFRRPPAEVTDRKPATETNRVENAPAKAGSPESAKPGNSTNSALPLASVLSPDTPPKPSISNKRVRFAKGAITSIESGSLSKGEIRNYLLACRAGQQLTAILSKSDKCMTFIDGSTEFQTTTFKGDNTVGVVNRCTNGGSYSVEITIR